MIPYILNNAAVELLFLLLLFLVVVPLMRRKRGGRLGSASHAPEASRFLGTQMDMALLVFGALMLLVLIVWLYRTFVVA